MGAIVILVIAVVVVLAVAGLLVGRARRKKQLRERFGPEYDRAVGEHGSERDAQRALEGREERRGQLDIRPLEPAERDRYAQAWRETQAQFVDKPSEAIGDAHALVSAVMRERGYPMDDFDQRAADVSVDHPQVVENYRAANAISHRHAQGQSSTEELRRAMVHYRSLFDELLGGDGTAISDDGTGPVERGTTPQSEHEHAPVEHRPGQYQEERR